MTEPASRQLRCCFCDVKWGVIALLVQVPSIAEDPAKWGPVLKRICWYVILAPASSDQVTLLATTAADKKLVELPAYKELLQSFITKEARFKI